MALSPGAQAPAERKSTALRSQRRLRPAELANSAILVHVAVLSRVTDSVKPLVRERGRRKMQISSPTSCCRSKFTRACHAADLGAFASHLRAVFGDSGSGVGPTGVAVFGTYQSASAAPPPIRSCR